MGQRSLFLKQLTLALLVVFAVTNRADGLTYQTIRLADYYRAYGSYCGDLVAWGAGWYHLPVTALGYSTFHPKAYACSSSVSHAQCAPYIPSLSTSANNASRSACISYHQYYSGPNVTTCNKRGEWTIYKVF